MGLRDEELTGHDVTCVVRERAGSGTHWRTYTGRTRAGKPVAIRTLQREIPDSSLGRFDDLLRQWVGIADRESARNVVDWGSDPRPWVAVEYEPAEIERYAAGKMVDAVADCDDRTNAELVGDVCEIVRTYSRYGSTSHHLAIHPDCLSVRDGSDGPVAVVDDWGLSRLASDPPVTPYTAPEQLEVGEHASKRTDVYRVGVLAAHLLSGSTPFPKGIDDDDDPDALANAIRDGIDEATLPEGVRSTIARATAVDPADRYPTTHKFRLDLLEDVPATGKRNTDPIAAVGTPAPDRENVDAADERDDSDEPSGTDDGGPKADRTSETTAADVGESTREADASGSGSRRAVLKYGAVVASGVGAAYLGYPLLAGDDSTGGSLPVDDAESGPDAVSGGTVHVDVGHRSWLEALEDVADDAGVPPEVDIRLRTGAVGSPERVEELRARAESGDPQPDLVTVNEAELGTLTAAEATEPLGEYVTSGRIEDAFSDLPPAYREMSVHPNEDEPHAIPYGFSPLVIAYHTEPLREIGLDGSEFERWITDPPTMEYWSEAVSVVREELNNPLGFIWAGDTNYLSWMFTTVLSGFGGAYYDTVDASIGPIGERNVTVASSAAVEAANVVHDFVTGDDRSALSIQQCATEDVFSFGLPEVQELFFEREAVAAQMPLSFAFNAIEEFGADDIGIVPGLTGPERPATTAFGSYVALNPNTEHLAESLEVASAFRSSEFAEAIVDSRSEIPFGRGPLADGLFDSTPYEPYVDAIRSSAEWGVPEPAGEAWIYQRNEIGELVRYAVTGTEPEAVLEELAELIEDD
ncbi:extracellular solute-binding protein [Natrarchaeobius oligotrophus]|uniref:Extracellular solute-binding protein n=1 Tax=Natrarchaeobius chitinivorans TaxID=1679083 RepID=A0A3N6M703_NATCH|nr:extracellular solute-binding protein [Natrarchaeobius chitinivorans]RQG99388.1 extracellular solute-binding protein [Natrarchaeobius chitinivorans]